MWTLPWDILSKLVYVVKDGAGSAKTSWFLMTTLLVSREYVAKYTCSSSRSSMKFAFSGALGHFSRDFVAIPLASLWALLLIPKVFSRDGGASILFREVLLWFTSSLFFARHGVFTVKIFRETSCSFANLVATGGASFTTCLPVFAIASFSSAKIIHVYEWLLRGFSSSSLQRPRSNKRLFWRPYEPVSLSFPYGLNRPPELSSGLSEWPGCFLVAMWPPWGPMVAVVVLERIGFRWAIL